MISTIPFEICGRKDLQAFDEIKWYYFNLNTVLSFNVCLVRDGQRIWVLFKYTE